MIIKLKRYFSFISYWVESVHSMKKFIQDYNKEFQSESKKVGEQKICVVIQPWLTTPAPFFSMATGLLLLKRGNYIDFLIDDFTFGKSSLVYKIQIVSIRYLGKILAKNVTVFYLSEMLFLKDSTIVPDSYLDSLVFQNSVHFMKGELKNEGRQSYKELIKSQLVKAKPYIYGFFSSHKYDFINISGGIYSTTGIYLAYAKYYNTRVSTYDAGFGVLVSSVDGIAAQLSDIPYGVSVLKKEINTIQLDVIKAFSLKQIDDRKSGTDAFGFLDTGTNIDLIPEDVGVLILLNSVWDSAALGINTIYSSYVEWLDDTLAYLLNNTSRMITVRQHPGEKLDYQKPSDDLDTHLKQKFNNNERILFVDCYSKINTYQLIEAADLIICFSSTTGIESAILGKRVIVSSNCYYSSASFVSRPSSLNHYYDLIKGNGIHNIPATQESLEEAILFYFLGQLCNWIFTDFTPMPDDFKKWVKNYKELMIDNNVGMYLKSMEDFVPISVLVAREKIKELI